MAGEIQGEISLLLEAFWQVFSITEQGLLGHFRVGSGGGGDKNRKYK